MNDSIVIFDTDFISEYARGKPEAIGRLNRTPPESCFTTVVTEAELLGPRFRQLLTAADEVELSKAQVNLNVVRDVLANAFVGIFQTDLKVCLLHSELRRSKGLSKIGNADLLIAAIALRNDATLVTGNVEHFHKIPRLNVEDFRQR